MTIMPDNSGGRRGRAILIAAFVGFVAFVAIGTASHEMWRDEHHAWLLARDAATPLDVLRNLEWDMTPPVWHYVLWCLTRFTHDPYAMQVVNAVFAIAAAGLVLRFLPFAIPLRVGFVFSYFLAYEYAAISRVYALGALFLFLVSALWPDRARRAVAIGVLLVLLANTPSFYGAVAAGFFVLLALFESLQPGSKKAALTIVAIGSVGILLALAQAMPQAENPFARGKMTMELDTERLERLAAMVVSVSIPVPDATKYEYWNSNVVAGRAPAADYALALLCLTGFAFLLRRYPAPLLGWCAVTAAVLFAGYQGGFLGVRHGSFIPVMFVVALWIGTASEKVEDGQLPVGDRAILATMLAVWVAGAFVALTKEVRTEFTAVDAASRYLREQGLDRLPIAGANDFVVASLASTLDLDRIYYPQKGGFGTFVRWSPDRRLHTTMGELGRDVALRVERSNAPMVVVLSVPPVRQGPFGDEIIRQAWLADGIEIRLLAAFTESVVADEKLWIYLAKPG